MLEQPLRDHPLRLALDPDLPLIHCDAVLIQRMLVNLLENAAKYTPADTVIGVTASAATDRLTVEVWDEGSEDQQTICPFVRTALEAEGHRVHPTSRNPARTTATTERPQSARSTSTATITRSPCRLAG